MSLIYNTMLDTGYLNEPHFLTIHAFIHHFKAVNRQAMNGIDQLLMEQEIFGIGPDASGETNFGQIDTVLPVYKKIEIGASPLTTCSVIDYGTYNRLGNRSFLYFEIDDTGPYEFTMRKISGDDIRIPDFKIYRQGAAVGSAVLGRYSTDRTLVNAQINLFHVGFYTVDAFDQRNISENMPGNGCYEFSIRPL